MKLFKNTKLFSIVFFIFLLTDILIKVYLEVYPYRYISKPTIILLLTGFYFSNQLELNSKKNRYTIVALFFFLLGDIFFINTTIDKPVMITMLFYGIGKIFYSLRFSNTKDFKIKELMPLVVISFIFIWIIYSVVYDNLGEYLIPMLIYVFITLLMTQIAFLRKKAVDYKSFLLVFLGILMILGPETVMALKMFYSNIAFQDVIIMAGYGIGQYLIIIGITKEILVTENEEILDSNFL